jgi:hypothetical protein
MDEHGKQDASPSPSQQPFGHGTQHRRHGSELTENGSEAALPQGQTSSSVVSERLPAEQHVVSARCLCRQNGPKME